MIKKILSILMAVIMIFGVAQIAFAAEKVFDENFGAWLYKENGFEYDLDEKNGELDIYYYVGTGDTIYIPKTLDGYTLPAWDIDAWLFRKTDASAFSVDADNEYFSVKDGVLFSKDGTELIAYPNGKAGDSYDIPEGVVTLCEKCFYYSSLKEVTLPSTLQDIESDVFGESFDGFADYEDGLYYAGNVLVKHSDSYFDSSSDEAVKFVNIKEGTEKILSEALPNFRGFVIIPDTVTEICGYQYCLYMCGSNGSAAQKFAEENNIYFIVMGEGHEHAYVRTVALEPTCVSEGRADYMCPCGDVKYSCAIEADTENGHKFVMNRKGQRICEYCGAEDESYCSCKCHEIGTYGDDFFGILKDLFLRLRLVIWHLMGTHQYCECGRRHY